MIKTKSEALKIFVCELTYMTSTFKNHNARQGGCDDNFITCLEKNLNKACKDVKLGFTGLYLQHENDGRVLIRVLAPGKRISKSFSLSKYTIKEAFLKSVMLRAEYCGFVGTLPVDKLKIPTAKDLLETSFLIKDEKWCAQHNIEEYFKKATR